MTNPKANALIQNFSDQNFWNFINDRNRGLTREFEPLSDLQNADHPAVHKVGELEFSETEKLLVCSIAVDRSLNERSGKKAQFDLAKQILNLHNNDADGLFVFHDPQGNFRFSLVYREFAGNRLKLSNYRRFTYYVSPQLTNKTFLQRIGDGDFSSLEKIKEAFSVEKVTKDFYQEVSYWYFWACQQAHFPPAAEREENGRQIAVIRLITRLIFIWFMREKGLIPSGLFDQQTISQCLTDLDTDSSSYYLAILQNLFFTTLNTRMADRQFRSEVRGFKGYNPDFGNQYKYRHQVLIRKPECIQELFCNIPFLNGGLFDCLDNRDAGDYFDGFSDNKRNQPLVPNHLFFSAETAADFNTELGTSNKQYKVKGLFEILSAYNFTIDENTADDKEVALDPELLGRVFENLLASFNPETSTTARKATGSYYTPREIVDYMVDESLKAYLSEHLQDLAELDQKLTWLLSAQKEGNPFTEKEARRIVKLVENVRIVDPAVGSGAFPMGALNKLVFILSKLDPNGNLWQQAQLDAATTIPDPQIRADVQTKIRKSFSEKNHDYGRKLYLIQKCIYGVDIQQIAVEIAKLRFFISLLVDETVDPSKDNWGVEPLPNLDFKIMQGNSLISVYEGIDLGPRGAEQPKQTGLFAGQGEKAELIRELRNRKEQYQTESNHQRKHLLQKEIEKYLLTIFKLNALEQHQDYASRLAAIDRKYQGIPNSKTREKLKAIEKEKISKEVGININASGRALNNYSAQQMKRDFFPWRLFFAEVFSEKGGFDIVIGNPPYINVKRGIEDKKILSDLFKLAIGQYDLFVLFIEFGLSLTKNVLSYIVPKPLINNENYISTRKMLLHRNLNSLVIGSNIFESAGVESCVFISTPSRSENLTRFYEYKNSVFEEKNLINQSAFTKLPFSIISSELRDSDFGLFEKINHGGIAFGDYFQITRGVECGKRDPRISKLKNNYPLLRGEDVIPFNTTFQGYYIKFDERNSSDFKDLSLYKNEKILIRRVAQDLIATYDKDGFIALNTLYCCLPKTNPIDIKLFVGILNSKLIRYWFKKTFVLTDKLFPYLRLSQLVTIPMVPINQENKSSQTEISKIVELLTNSGNGSLEQRTNQWVNYLNDLIFDLYDISAREIDDINQYYS